MRTKGKVDTKLRARMRHMECVVKYTHSLTHTHAHQPSACAVLGIKCRTYARICWMLIAEYGECRTVCNGQQIGAHYIRCAEAETNQKPTYEDEVGVCGPDRVSCSIEIIFGHRLRSTEFAPHLKIDCISVVVVEIERKCGSSCTAHNNRMCSTALTRRR